MIIKKLTITITKMILITRISLVPNASMMGLSDGRKSFQILLVVLIQYRL